MQATLSISCEGCGKHLGQLKVDTADMPEVLQHRVNKIILQHRAGCEYYGGPATASPLVPG